MALPELTKLFLVADNTQGSGTVQKTGRRSASLRADLNDGASISRELSKFRAAPIHSRLNDYYIETNTTKFKNILLGSSKSNFPSGYSISMDSAKTFSKASAEGKTTSTTASDYIGEGRSTMDWQEKYFDKMDKDFTEMKDSLRATEDRIARNIEQSMAEMRDRDNQRHSEFLSIKNEFSELRTEIAESKRWNLGTFISVAALALASVIGIITVALR